LADPESILARQDLVTAFVKSSALRSGWKDGVNVPDLDSLSAKLTKAKAGLRDLVSLYSFARALGPIVNKLEAYDGPKAMGCSLKTKFVKPLKRCAVDFGQYISMIDLLVDDPTSHEPRVSSKMSPELKNLAEQRTEIEEDIQKTFRRIKDNSEFSDEIRLEKDSIRGVVMRTKKSNEKGVRAIPTVSIAQVLKDGIYFTTASLKRLADALLDVNRDYEKAQASLLVEAVKVGRSFLPVLEVANSRISELDAIASMATLAASAPHGYVKPVISDDGYRPAKVTTTSSKSISSSSSSAADDAEEEKEKGISSEQEKEDEAEERSNLEQDEDDATTITPSIVRRDIRRVRVVQGRHPVVEMLDDMSFIANDYSMDCAPMNDQPSSSSATSEGLFHIITGPNMGGKSTYIKTLGALCVMMQVGSYVPAESAELPVLDCICARVGAGDSALKGVSTFMAEMLEATAILDTATKRSLVIIDELGRGTSTYDGFGLAWSISEHLALKSKPLSLFATHYHELTALADEIPGGVVRNKHVTAFASDGGITMLYTVNDGVCLSSFGIMVAESAAFPQSVLNDAKEKARQLESTSGVVMTTRKKKKRTMMVGSGFDVDNNEGEEQEEADEEKKTSKKRDAEDLDDSFDNVQYEISMIAKSSAPREEKRTKLEELVARYPTII
jgi:DNA mismatch repair protein MSH2